MSRLLIILAVALAAAPPAVAAQTLGQDASPEMAWWRVLGALLLCLALAVAGALALRARMGGQAPTWQGLRLGRAFGPGTAITRRLRLVESLRVSPQVNVCLVGCDDAEFLVAVSPQGVAITPVPKTEGA